MTKIIEVNSVTTSQGAIIKLDIVSQDYANDVIAKFRSSHSNMVAADREEMKSLRLNHRMHLYICLGAFTGIAVKLLAKANVKFLVAALGEHGLSPARAGANPYRPIADMLFGEWKNVEVVDKEGKKRARKVPDEATATRVVNGKKQFFVPNRSAEKYAKVARYVVSQKWKLSEIAEKMSNFKGGMDGIIKADTAATRMNDQDELETDDLVEMIYSSKPHHTLGLSDCGLSPKDAERTLVGLWAEIKDGEVLIRGVLPTSEDALSAYVRKFAKGNAEKLLRQHIEALTVGDKRAAA